MKAINKLSDDDLRFLLCMMGTIKNTIEDYSHVDEHIPLNMLNTIDSFNNKLNDELDKRQSND